MKPLNLLIALIGLSTNLVSASCFFTGARWQNRTAARMLAFTACKGDGVNRGVFQAEFAAKQNITQCVQYSATQRIVFNIENLDAKKRAKLDENHCVGRLHHEILICVRGGSSKKGQWRFRADPNDGICEEVYRYKVGLDHALFKAVRHPRDLGSFGA